MPFIYLLLAGGVIYAIAYSKTGLGIKALQISISDIKNVGISAGMLNVSFDLQALNPNSSTVTLQTVVGQIIYNGTILGTFNYAQPLPITGKNSITTIRNIGCRFNLLSLGSNILDILTGGLKNIPITIKGTLTADGINFPINEQKTLNIG